MDNDNNLRPPLKIAIIGAGLVGSVTAILLSKLPNIDVKLFERSPKLHEVGAWIAVTNSSFQILQKIIDIDELNSIVYRGDDYKTSITRHWQSGEILYVQPQLIKDVKLVEARTQRIALHNLLLRHVPVPLINYNHHATNVEFETNGPTTVHFANQPSIKLDIVVAADGIYSKLRRQFHPAEEIKYKGVVLYRSVFAESLVANIANLPNDTSSWIRQNGDCIFMSRLGLQQYGIVALIKEPLETLQNLKWDDKLGELAKLRLQQHFKDWDPIITKVLDIAPSINSFPLETTKWVSNLVIDNRLVFVGDAAHPTAGAYGAGSSFGFADAWALYRSLQESPIDLPLALSMYNKTRLNFLQRVEKQIKIDSQISTLLRQEPDEVKWKKLVVKARQGGNWMKTHDVELEFEKTRDENLISLLFGEK